MKRAGESDILGSMRAVAVIPARYGSTRLEGKPLADILGRPMIQWVYENVRAAGRVEKVIVATDDERIEACARGFGAEVVMTSSGCRTGSERVAEVAHHVDATVVVNVQADEPFVEPALIDRLVEAMEEESVDMATPMTPIGDEHSAEDPNVVKVVADRCGFALYFSRSPIPYRRHRTPFTLYKHMGIYVYRKEVLLRISGLPTTPLEETEGLEQLRALEHGYRIRLVESYRDAPSVDTREDLEEARRFARRLSHGRG